VHREILGLWHTGLLRPSKLTVQDEIENSTGVFRRSLLAVVPASTLTSWVSCALRASFMHAGAPHPCCGSGRGSAGIETATPLSTAPPSGTPSCRQSQVALEHYLDEINTLGGAWRSLSLLPGSLGHSHRVLPSSS